MVIFFFSLSVNKLIILENEGYIGYSNLAARRIEIVAKFTSFYVGKFQWPIRDKYLSKMAEAQNRVSTLYPFSLWRYTIFYMPPALPFWYVWVRSGRGADFRYC